MISRSDILEKAIEETVKIVEETIKVDVSDEKKAELYILLDDDYLNVYKPKEIHLFNSDCWGGGVWDRLYHYGDRYKHILVLNHTERQYRMESPVMAPFPYEKLNVICKNALQEINKIL